ncbi:S-adenosyl-L-methionine-dependent methyltransferase [Rhizodiscina lignyota]|uniref:S-adenosyl-L-methionine-dependent methyltransferase n=1 Tax=Rhizodiscina lignyota TaxID=1504668 RepID=A0A9P4IF51_9PEZI|nr:S-adenosyl-L-methionine-dependent methyltransferase [Rhizodiscina lignyota]
MASELIPRFKNQYIQQVNVQELDWPRPELLRLDRVQQELWKTIFSPDALQYPPPERYEARVLKELVKKIEGSLVAPDEDDILDELLSHLASLLSNANPSEAVAAQQKSYVTYTFPGNDISSASPQHITLLENRTLLFAAGTTGLRTWEDALHLGSYLTSSHGRALVEGKNVLELGAGTGLLSILSARHLGAKHVLATDGDASVVESIKSNFFLNALDTRANVECAILRWGTYLGGMDHEGVMSGMFDVILGADITYDAKFFPGLVSTFEDLLELRPSATIIISAIVRNEKTSEEFVGRCRARKFHVEDIPFEREPPSTTLGPFYSDAVPIRIMRITK